MALVETGGLVGRDAHNTHPSATATHQPRAPPHLLQQSRGVRLCQGVPALGVAPHLPRERAAVHPRGAVRQRRQQPHAPQGLAGPEQEAPEGEEGGGEGLLVGAACGCVGVGWVGVGVWGRRRVLWGWVDLRRCVDSARDQSIAQFAVRSNSRATGC